MPAELRTRLESGLGVRLASDFVWRHPTLAALADGPADALELPLDSAEEVRTASPAAR